MSFAVVHLVRRQNGPEPLHRFLEAYARHPPSVEHDLVLAMKGFPTRETAHRELALARDIGAGSIFLPDDGFDLMAYFRVAASVPCRHYCFLNSFARPLVDCWLAPFADAFAAPDVALVGATGSWASQLDYLRYQLGLRSGYDEVFEDREAMRRAFLDLARRRDPAIRDRGRAVARVLTAAALLRQSRGFGGFPAPHVRTNAVAIRRDLMLELRPRRVRTKLEAYRLESGRMSLTARVRELGLRALIVGRNGNLYDPDAWPESNTFWQGSQENLLVADNRTDDYQQGGTKARLLLARLAWGERARPG